MAASTHTFTIILSESSGVSVAADFAAETESLGKEALRVFKHCQKFGDLVTLTSAADVKS